MTLNPVAENFPVLGTYLEPHEKGKYPSCVSSEGTPPVLANAATIKTLVSKDEEQAWTEAHPPKYRGALRELTSRIQCVAFTTFQTHLLRAIEKLNNADTQELPYVVLVEGQKSNQWVAELAYKDLRRKPQSFYRLGIKEAQVFTQHLEILERNAKAHERSSLEELQRFRKIVLFDDGSYSGKQLSLHVAAIFKKMFDISRALPSLDLSYLEVHVVCPFMTQHAANLIKETKTGSSNYRLFLHASVIIPTVSDSISKDNRMLLNELFWPKEKDGASTRGVLWFEHKIPNGASFIKGFAEGTVHYGTETKHKAERTAFYIIPEIAPPYKSSS